jgi:DNA-binding response OmpR family regulator
MRILLTEDNVVLANLLRDHLGKSHVLDLAHNLKKARFLIDTQNYDLFILDLVLPDGNGFQVRDYLQENSIHSPILYLTAELDFEQKITCLQSGASYLSKPFNIRELEVKVESLLSNNQQRFFDESKSDGLDLRLDPFSHTTYLKGREIKLNRKEFALLHLFLEYQGQVLSKTILAEKVWQEEEVVFGNTIEATIANLRRKIGKNLIKATKGVGYSIHCNQPD